MELRADDNRVFMAFSVVFVVLAALSTQRLGKFYFTIITFAISDDFAASFGGFLEITSLALRAFETDSRFADVLHAHKNCSLTRVFLST